MFEKFKKPEVSRESYEKADELRKDHYHFARFRGTILDMPHDAAQAVYRGLWEQAAESEKKVNKLYARSQQEATEINQEYEELKSRARQTLSALAEFEHNKLGMHNDTEVLDGESRPAAPERE